LEGVRLLLPAEKILHRSVVFRRACVEPRLACRETLKELLGAVELPLPDSLKDAGKLGRRNLRAAEVTDDAVAPAGNLLRDGDARVGDEPVRCETARSGSSPVLPPARSTQP